MESTPIPPTLAWNQLVDLAVYRTLDEALRDRLEKNVTWDLGWTFKPTSEQIRSSLLGQTWTVTFTATGYVIETPDRLPDGSPGPMID